MFAAVRHPEFNTVVLWCNVAGALLAFVANTWAALTGWRDWLWLRITIAAFAGFYALSYATFALGWWTLEQWSPFMRGVSVIVWPVVWAGPAVYSTAVWRRMVREARRQIEAAEAQRVG